MRMIRASASRANDVLGGDRGLPELRASMRPASDLAARPGGGAIIVDTIALPRRSVEDVEHALRVGLHEPGVAFEQLANDLAGLDGCVLEEHVIGVGDLDEEARAPARL